MYILIGEIFFDTIFDAIRFWLNVSVLLLFFNNFTILLYNCVKILKHPVETFGYSFIFSLSGNELNSKHN